MEIRQAEPEEAEKALAFYYNLIDGMQDAEYPIRWVKGVYPTLEDMKTAAGEGNLFLAKEQGEITGAFVLNHSQNESYMNVHWTFDADPDKTAVLHLLATDPSRQRQGIGKALLREAVNISQKREDRVMRLDTLTWNIPGQKLYEGFGFHCCGDVELDYPSTGKIPFRMYEYRISERADD